MKNNEGSKIVVYNVKGGQGKTDIAINLALTMDFSFVTNEMLSPIDIVLPESDYLKLDQGQDCPQFGPEYDVIFDFGGYLDKRVVSAIKQADFVLIPVVNEFKDVYTTVNFIQEIEPYGKKIIIIANRTKKGDFEAIKEIMGEHYPTLKVFEIKESRAMPNILTHKMSIKQMCKEFPLHRRYYEIVDEQFDIIIQEIRS